MPVLEKGKGVKIFSNYESVYIWIENSSHWQTRPNKLFSTGIFPLRIIFYFSSEMNGVINKNLSAEKFETTPCRIK